MKAWRGAAGAGGARLRDTCETSPRLVDTGRPYTKCPLCRRLAKLGGFLRVDAVRGAWGGVESSNAGGVVETADVGAYKLLVTSRMQTGRRGASR